MAISVKGAHFPPQGHSVFVYNLTMLNFTSARDFGAGLSSGCTWSERDGPDV